MRIPPRLPMALLVVYTGLLLTATHWPGLAIHGPVDRTDLIIHVGVFLVWGVLLGLSGLVGRSAGLLLICGVLFAVFDETTQPLFDRTFDPFDLLADVAGVLLASGAMALLWRRSARRSAAAGAGAGA